MKNFSSNPEEKGRVRGTNFLVSIHHQENHTWQGSIQWLDTGQKCHFRSELELMNLIHGAVSAGASVQEPLRSWEEDELSQISGI